MGINTQYQTKQNKKLFIMKLCHFIKNI